MPRIPWEIRRNFYKNSKCRVRFAPSPTGFLHLGGLRTALYNYLFARSQDGSFILRIEDTDQTRVVPGAMEQLRDDLIWAGIIPDEDPIRDGPVGPYIQSKRIDLYQTQVKTLLDNGSAYKCFCTESRLKLLKNTALKERQIPKYDNRCRNFTSEEIKERLMRGDKYCIRFKLIPTPEPFHDLIYGDITYNVAQNEGDPIIMKSDGFPTYHFANVVDDHFMAITHVMRGVEWQISTPKHLLLYKAFGWTPPLYAHLPLIMNSDNTKLSKRQDDIRVEHYKREGIFPLALINYITAAGGGFNRHMGLSHCYSYEELIKQFDISKVNVNSSKLNPDKLMEFNQLEIANLLNNKKNHEFLVERVIELLKQTFPDRVSDGSLEIDPVHIITTLTWAHNRITKLNDLVTPDLKFLWIKPTTNGESKNLKYLEMIGILSKKLESIDETNFCKESLKIYLKEFAINNNVAFPDLMKTLRSLLSGLKEGPSVVEMMEILGRDATLNRLKRKA
ncbi:probable glutamate--tRNA ligase, mitochondrial [Phymastichus coffea]|uniref:probable glutamate--tRNA ligase, mitochondrial n=1 Tax=Phymastichus coffea TaxID=108790 RepID=UPI00273A7C38|nr:probable glutamate--tRNA ligase, mitochondrial [Phymastichus coffea]XP_058801776.1 probable glutamate--tRNA ligase, mitochondrial [Phymastichus coffea]